MEVVRNMNTLKKLAKAGLIKLHPHTGCKFSNGVKAYYIDDRTEGTPYTFEYKGRKYQVQFRPGCFYPFVVQIL